MIKNLSLLLITLFSFSFLQAQTVEELTAQKEAKAAELAKLEGELGTLQGKVDGLKAEVADLTEKTTPYPRWDTGMFGTVGFNLTRFNNWFQKDQSNTSAATIGFTLNGKANLQQKKYFWRNSAGLNLSWLKFDNKDDDTDNEDFQVASDAMVVSSLFGWKLTDKWAISALGEYRTALLDEKFNNPGTLDLGAGATWTPMNDLVVVIHPGNYNFVFSNDDDTNFNSSLGLKLVADYSRQLSKGVAWKTNFSTFMSYENSDYSNWTWTNGFTTAVKRVGIGIDIGLRQSKQEAMNFEPNYEGGNPLQVYYVLGLSYGF